MDSFLWNVKHNKLETWNLKYQFEPWFFQVVCRELGYTDALSAHHGSVYPQGTGSIILDNVRCVGTEPSLLQCLNNGIKVHNCGHSEDAGAVCSEEGTYTVKPALVTTCLQRPPVYIKHIFCSLENGFSLKHVLKEPVYKIHWFCFHWADEIFLETTHFKNLLL